MKAADLYSTACSVCGCDDPNCGLVFGPKCHPESGTNVKFFKGTRTLSVTCAECGEHVVSITELAGKEPVEATEPAEAVRH